MNADNHPVVSFITVNYNGKRYLKDCFDSLNGLHYPADKVEIIMVDNGSDDGSIEFTEKNFPGVKIIRNDVNNYCRANNAGIRASRGEYIALINNDLKVDARWAAELVNVLQQDSAVGAATCKVFFFDGKLQAAGHYELPDFYWSDRGFKEDDKGQYDEIEDVPSISHCAALYRRGCFDNTGLLDEDFNMYLEDVDMSIRAKQKGWRLVYVPQAIAYHKFHGSAEASVTDFYCERNRLLLIAKHFPRELPGALLGKGYFTAVNNKSGLLKILPEVFSKLMKHHTAETIIAILPGLFDSVNKISNLEKDLLVKQLDAEKNQARTLLQQKDEAIAELKEKASRELVQKDQLIRQKDEAIAELKANANRERAQRDQFLRQREEEIAELKKTVEDAAARVRQKDGEITKLKDEINCARALRDADVKNLEEKINRIYTSETYRFIAIPLWRILTVLKRLKGIPEGSISPRILIIKPRYVGEEEAAKAVKHFAPDPGIRVTVVTDDGRGFAVFKLIFRLRREKFTEAIVLIGKPVYHGYRKSKLLAVFSGVKNIRLYFTGSGDFEVFRSSGSWGALWRGVYGVVMVIAVAAVFYACIVFPLKLRKLFGK
jgi:GT2 family glycosyltransferase